VTLTAEPRAPVKPPRHRGRHAEATRRVVHVVGELMVTGGVLVLMFLVWQLWGTGIQTGQTQDSLRQQLAQQWSGAAPAGSTGSGPSAVAVAPVRPTAPAPAPSAPAPSAVAPSAPAPSAPAPSAPDVSVSPGALAPGPPVATPAEGDPLLRLQIPSIGLDWVVVQGVDLVDLAKGPGHYPGTAMPGQVGNFAIAGHRTTHGAPFFRIGELRPGDVITAQVKGRRYTYQVFSRDIVNPDQVSVVAPVPDQPGVTATDRLLTLTSCNPKYSASQRLIVHARYVSTATD